MKRNIKKSLLIVTLAVMVLGVAGCGNSQKNAADDGKIQIVCTTFPQYDWARQIVGENNSDVELSLLIENGTDIHNYQPSAMDIATVSNSDMFIYIGGESDIWAADIVAEAMNKDMIVINMVESLGDAIHEEEIVEGMEGADHDHEAEDHDHEAETDHDHEDEDEDHDHEAEYDEHVWLSLRNAGTLCGVIKDSLVEADSKNAAEYEANYSAYLEKLNELDGKYENVVKAATRNVFLFGDRFPFRYMVEDYGIDYYAAFVGCSAETEASFGTIAFLSGKIDELELPYVLIIENSSEDLANTIIANTTAKNQQILVMDSLQSITKERINQGTTYISVMEENLEVLKTALN